jgi:hypothetical protein
MQAADDPQDGERCDGEEWKTHEGAAEGTSRATLKPAGFQHTFEIEKTLARSAVILRKPRT